MDNKLRVQRIKKAMDCDTNTELAKKLNVNRSQITRWSIDGFSKSVSKIIDYFLNNR